MEKGLHTGVNPGMQSLRTILEVTYYRYIYGFTYKDRTNMTETSVPECKEMCNNKVDISNIQLNATSHLEELGLFTMRDIIWIFTKLEQ